MFYGSLYALGGLAAHTGSGVDDAVDSGGAQTGLQSDIYYARFLAGQDKCTHKMMHQVGDLQRITFKKPIKFRITSNKLMPATVTSAKLTIEFALRHGEFGLIETEANDAGQTRYRNCRGGGMDLISTSGGTGDNKSSFCVDILNRRPNEVDYIYGKVITRRREKGTPKLTLAPCIADEGYQEPLSGAGR